MSFSINNKKLTELSIGLFGTFSVYLIYGIIYQRLIMSPYQNSQTNAKQFFASSAGFVLIQRGVSWMLTEICTAMFDKKQQKQPIPHKYSLICGVFIFFSAISFVHGVYTTAFRYSFVVKTGVFAASTLMGYLLSLIRPFARSPKRADIITSLCITLFIVLFWVFDPEICFYVPIQPKVIANVLMIVSCFTDGGVSIVQAKIVDDYKPTLLHMMRDISRWTFAFALIYTMTVGDLLYTFTYLSTHPSFTFQIIILSMLFFIGQLLIYRAFTRMTQNIPAYLSTSRKVLNVFVSFSFSVHNYHYYQVIGMFFAWVNILLQALFIVQKDKTENKNKIEHSYNQMAEVESDGE